MSKFTTFALAALLVLVGSAFALPIRATTAEGPSVTVEATPTFGTITVHGVAGDGALLFAEQIDGSYAQIGGSAISSTGVAEFCVAPSAASGDGVPNFIVRYFDHSTGGTTWLVVNPLNEDGIWLW